MEEIIEKVEYLIEKQPQKMIEFIKHMYKHNPEAVEKMLSTMKEHGHITSYQKYDELVNKLKWANKMNKGERWKLDELKRDSQVDFKNVDYTEFDYAYLVNMLHAKCCKCFSEKSFYLKLAKCLLEDDDEETKLYKGAYSDKQKHHMRGEQSFYNDYDEENRRKRRYRSESEYDEYDEQDEYDEENRKRRHYRSERMNDNDYYNEENRRGRYRNEYDDRSRYYKESNMGFSI
jgi:hypothetical protein